MEHKGKSGEYLTTNPPFGYMKKPENPKEWIIDEPAAEVVRRIFNLCIAGKGPTQIAKQLQTEKALNPTVYWRLKGLNTNNHAPTNKYHWTTETVKRMLERHEYLGHMVNFKTYRKSYKSRTKLDNPKENWIIYENVHDAIVTKEQFDRVQELRKNKRRNTKNGKTSLFSGLLRCADCGEKLYFCTAKHFEPKQDYFVCSNYKSNTGTCSAHFIRDEVLNRIVLHHMQNVLLFARQFEMSFVRMISEKSVDERQKELSEMKRTIQKNNRRIDELDRLFKRIYEYNISLKISDDRFAKLSAEYEKEQKELQSEVARLETEVAIGEEKVLNVEQFLATVKRYTEITELTPTIVNEFIRKIVIHAPDKSNGKRTQQVDIYYNAVGIVNVLPREEFNKMIEEHSKSKQQQRTA